VYGQGLGWQSPLYKSMSLEGNKIRITFAGAEGGLASAGGPLRQFAIAGSDQKFVWANAKIAGSTVVVWNDAVPNPVAVRYAFSGDPEGANLTSAAGMPAAGFRTDNWDTVTRVPSAGPH